MYTVYRRPAMPAKRRADRSEVLTLRVPRALAAQLDAEARRQRRSRSAVARTALAKGLGAPESDPHAEARRQSRLASKRTSDREALQFVVDKQWIPVINARYIMGLDGISLPLLALTLLVVPLCVIYSWNHFPEPKNPKAFLTLMLILFFLPNGLVAPLWRRMTERFR